MTDSEKLLILADACSDVLLGGERGWEIMDFKKFANECRKAIALKNKLTTETPPTNYQVIKHKIKLLFMRKDKKQKAARRIEELERTLNNLLNDCINFDGGKLTECFMEDANRVLKKI